MLTDTWRPSGHFWAPESSASPAGNSRVRTVLSGTLMFHVSDLRKSSKRSEWTSAASGVHSVLVHSTNLKERIKERFHFVNSRTVQKCRII